MGGSRRGNHGSPQSTLWGIEKNQTDLVVICLWCVPRDLCGESSDRNVNVLRRKTSFKLIASRDRGWCEAAAHTFFFVDARVGVFSCFLLFVVGCLEP